MRDTNRVTIVIGHYGTGKSECSVGLSLWMRARRPALPITLIDLDVVNPYFRSREARALLAECDIAVIGNSLEIDLGVDVPAIPGTIPPALHDQDRHVIIDLGGDAAGSRALRQFRPHIPTEDTEVLYVVNPFRTENRNAESTLLSIRSIEEEVGLRCTGLVNNGHLLHETVCDHIVHGNDVCRRVTELSRLPVVYVTMRRDLFESCRERIDALEGTAVPLVSALRQDWMNSGNSHTT